MTDLLLMLGCVSAVSFATWRSWKLTRSHAIVIGSLCCYYWSLHGAWTLLFSSGGLGAHDYLLDDLIAMEAGNDYRLTIVMYTAFICTLLSVVPIVAQSSKGVPDDGKRVYLRSHLVMLICALAGFASLMIIRNSVGISTATGISLYNLTRYEGVLGGWAVVLTILNRIALVPAAIGLATWMSGPNARFAVTDQGPRVALGFLTIIAGMLSLCFVLGNKNEVLFAGLSGAVFYLFNSPRPRTIFLGAVLTTLVGALMLIDIYRHASVDDVKESITGAGFVDSLTSIGTTGECFAAHLSLYGVLKERVEPLLGHSFYALAASVVPKSLWEDRPEEIYWYYIDEVGASTEQGFTIHQATGWYLNFGAAGVLIGGIVIGGGWGWTHALLRRSRRYENTLPWRVLSTFAVCTFTGNFPTLLRTGIEGYKGFFLHSFVTSLLVMVLCCRLTGKGSRHRRMAAGSTAGATSIGRKESRLLQERGARVLTP